MLIHRILAERVAGGEGRDCGRECPASTLHLHSLHNSGQMQISKMRQEVKETPSSRCKLGLCSPRSSTRVLLAAVSTSVHGAWGHKSTILSSFRVGLCRRPKRKSERSSPPQLESCMVGGTDSDLKPSERHGGGPYTRTVELGGLVFVIFKSARTGALWQHSFLGGLQTPQKLYAKH